MQIEPNDERENQPFVLQRETEKEKRWEGPRKDGTKERQKTMFDGLDAQPGQMDLFELPPLE